MNEITLDSYHEEIINFIINKDRVVTSDEVKEAFGIGETMSGNFNTRMTILAAIENYAVNHGIAIGGNNHGYFEIKTLKQLEKYRENLTNRIDGMRHRLELAIEGWNVGHNEAVEH